MEIGNILFRLTNPSLRFTFQVDRHPILEHRALSFLPQHFGGNGHLRDPLINATFEDGNEIKKIIVRAIAGAI